MKPLLAAALFALLTLNLIAIPNADFPKIDDTSFSEPNGSRIIQLSVEVSASKNEIWTVLSTAEGWKSFAVAFAVVDFQIGGVLETSYNPDARVGNPNNIKNQIVAYIPGRLLSIRCIQAPENFQHKQEFFATATTIEITPIKVNKSRVTLTAVGYGPGEAYDTLYNHFLRGDAYTLDKLRVRFETGQSTAPSESKEVKNFNTDKASE